VAPLLSCLVLALMIEGLSVFKGTIASVLALCGWLFVFWRVGTNLPTLMSTGDSFDHILARVGMSSSFPPLA